MSSPRKSGDSLSQWLPPLSVKSPPLSVKSPSPSKTKSVPSVLQLPLIPVATKAEKYEKLRQLDRQGLKRHKAHFRNALKTTEPIQKITKRLNERLSALGEDDGSVSFDRLAAFSEAFEGLIKHSGSYAPMLKKIKESMDEEVMAVLREDSQSEGLVFIPTVAEPSPNALPPPNQELAKLRKQLHQMEVEYRVAAEKNSLLRAQLKEEEELHKKAMAELLQPVEITPPEQSDEMDYVAQVEKLQQQIADEREAIAKVIEERKDRVPLSVCHQLEQCIREVEIEIQKQQRRNEKLNKEVDKLSKQLEAIFRSHGYNMSASEILAELRSARSEAATHSSSNVDSTN